MSNAVSVAQYGSSNPTMRNRIINGAMVINQRNGTNPTLVTVDNQYTLDRWTYRTAQLSKLTSTQSTNAPAGFSYSAQTSVTTSATPGSTDYVTFKQLIEGYNIADLNWGTANAKPLTISFWVYSSVAGTYGYRLINATGPSAYVMQYTVSANTWTYVTQTVTGPTSGTFGNTNGEGVSIQFDLGSGSSFQTSTLNSWITGDYIRASGNVQLITNASANWYVTGVQIESGTTATPFEYRQYGTEFMLCQRYYQTLSNNTYGLSVIGGVGPSNSIFHVYLPVTMRNAPNASGGGNTNTYYFNSVGGALQSASLAYSAFNVQANITSLRFYTSTAYGASGTSSWNDWNTFYINLTAEL